MSDTTEPLFKSEAELKAYIASHFPTMLDASKSKFAPKLSFAQRCEVYALMELKLDRRTIAAAYGINRATVAYITNPQSPHYKDVRKEFHELGRVRFLMQYMDEEVMAKYVSAQNDQQTLYSDDELKKAKEQGEMPDQQSANPKAVKSEGIFWFTGFWGVQVGTYKAEVKWTDEPGPDPADFLSETPRTPGWYVFVQDSESDTVYIAGSAADSKTSTSARDAWLKANEYELSR